MAQSRPTTTTDGAKALAGNIVSLQNRVRTLELREDPASSGGGSSPVYMIHESEFWLTALYAGGGFDFPDLGDTSYITAQSGDFEVVTHPAGSHLTFLLPEPGFYRFDWHWTFDISEGWSITGSIGDPYFWEIQTRLDTHTVDVKRLAAEVQTQIYTQGDGFEIRGSMGGVVEATADRLHLTPFNHRYAAYPQDWQLPTGTDFYSYEGLEEGTHGFAIEQIVAT